MIPTSDDVASFLAVAPAAGEGEAFLFIENASTVDEAVVEYLDNSDKYLQKPAPDMDSSKLAKDAKSQGQVSSPPPAYAPPARGAPSRHSHTNAVIQAAHVRAKDEQEMQMLLQNIQIDYKIYNSDIEPEHEQDYCRCPIHQYKWKKFNRLGVQEMWSKAVMYKGEKAYHDCYQATLFSHNPYRFRVISPFGLNNTAGWYGGVPRPSPKYYAMSLQQTIALNASLNAEAQAAVDALDPDINIWEVDSMNLSMASMKLNDTSSQVSGNKVPTEKSSTDKRQSIASLGRKPSRFASFKSALSTKTPEEKAQNRTVKLNAKAMEKRDAILAEESGRWPDPEWRAIVATYQEKVGMTEKIAHLRARYPTQYLHLLRAGYFEPIPIAWADQASNPLKFSIEAASGWRGITPSWRGYEDTAEERLYWVLNHRTLTANSPSSRLKPDPISALEMARARMATAVEPPPAYFSPTDTCHTQHTSTGYSKQVPPPPFYPYDAPETSNDDTMILLDVSGSMDFNPMRPNYNGPLITSYSPSTQPKNKDVAKAIIRRFTDAMANHDHNFSGYELTTFSTHAQHIGTITHQNLDEMWNRVKLGGGTRVMTGWQKIKSLHFSKHSLSATHHPTLGWQSGPSTPILRLLLLLDGEATDMDEFELELLSLDWVHITIFLIGVDGCPHHHRHANELQRISEVNRHVSFVDAQGNLPERFVTHELLKRHLGYEVSMREFEELEVPPPYVEVS